MFTDFACGIQTIVLTFDRARLSYITATCRESRAISDANSTILVYVENLRIRGYVPTLAKNFEINLTRNQNISGYCTVRIN